VLSICEDRSGALWVGTWKGGLNRFDRGSETFVRYTEDQGLPDITVYGILEDELGRLWLSTNKGISCFNPETEEFRNYDTRDGLQDDEFNGGAYFLSPSGQMFFGGINGFNAFYPGMIQENPHKAPIVITALLKSPALSPAPEAIVSGSIFWI
jgi:streptogramin lyase